MGRTYVRGHYRRRKKSRKQRGNRHFSQAFGISLLLIVGAYMMNKISLQVILQAISYFFALAITAMVLFIALRMYIVQHKKRQQTENQAQQEYMQQTQSYQQNIGQQQVFEYQPAMRQHQRQIQQYEKEHKHRAQIKTLGEILTLKSGQFEDLVGDLLKASGYTEVKRVGGSGDLGADLTAIDPQGKRTIVQCKRFAPEKTVGTPDLQKFIGMLVVHHKAERGIFVTTSTFKQTARDLADQHKDTIQLIGGDLLVQWLQNTAEM